MPWLPEDVPEIEMFPPPERILVGSELPVPIDTARPVCVAGPVGESVPDAPPPIMMFPIGSETASSHEPFVLRHALFPMTIPPEAPAEPDQSIKSPPLV